MFLSSSLHILNPDLFKFKNLDLFTGIITVVIFFISMVVFLKGFKKIYRYLDTLKLKEK